MCERIEKLYDNGRITKDGVRNAVSKGMITVEQYKEITGEDYGE